MDAVTALASIGAILSTVSNLPQVWKVRTLHTTTDLHSWTFVIHLLAAVTWSLYGFLLELYILGVESAIVGVLNALIILAIVRDRWWCPKQEIDPK